MSFERGQIQTIEACMPQLFEFDMSVHANSPQKLDVTTLIFLLILTFDYSLEFSGNFVTKALEYIFSTAKFNRLHLS